MITNKEYFKSNEFPYEEIQERIEAVIEEGILKHGEAVIRFDSEFPAGKVVVDKDSEFCKGLNIGRATISLRYANELLYQCHKWGFKAVLYSNAGNLVPNKLLICVDPVK